MCIYIIYRNVKKIFPGEKIDMTIPVTTEFTKGGATNQYEMCFYIGLEHQSNPAIPTDAQVTIQERPQLTVLTRSVLSDFERKKNSDKKD